MLYVREHEDPFDILILDKLSNTLEKKLASDI